MNKRLKNLIGIKKGAYRAQKRGNADLKRKYLRLNKEVQRKVRNAKRNYEIKVANESKINPKAFYQMYQTKAKEKVGPIQIGKWSNHRQ